MLFYDRYLKLAEKPQIAREELADWYDGYHTKAGERVYNPRSVVASLVNNNLGNYWTSLGYDRETKKHDCRIEVLRQDVL